MGDGPDPEEGVIGAFLTTRYPFHVEADFELLDAIFGVFVPLAVPDQHIGGTAGTIQDCMRCLGVCLAPVDGYLMT